LAEVIAKQDATEAAKQQANDEAEEKENLKQRKQEEREEMKRKMARQTQWQRARLEGVFNLHGRFLLLLLHQVRPFHAHQKDCGKAPRDAVLGLVHAVWCNDSSVLPSPASVHTCIM
jgi:hypothetical protein